MFKGKNNISHIRVRGAWDRRELDSNDDLDKNYLHNKLLSFSWTVLADASSFSKFPVSLITKNTWMELEQTVLHHFLYQVLIDSGYALNLRPLDKSLTRGKKTFMEKEVKLMEVNNKPVYQQILK